METIGIVSILSDREEQRSTLIFVVYSCKHMKSISDSNVNISTTININVNIRINTIQSQK